MGAIVNGYMTSDGDKLEEFFPGDMESFEVPVEAYIGMQGSEGFDNFVFTVVTPRKLEEKYGNNDAVFLRHFLLVKEWNANLIKNRIEKLVSSVSGKDWQEIANKLSRYGYWEFEDVQSIKK
ncbi:MAG: Imm8 family immunity protein [Oligoflexales bacterium]